MVQAARTPTKPLSDFAPTRGRAGVNTVPNCPEWQKTPGFETQDCHCVETCKKAWPDCGFCSGSGKIGVVPGTVWCHYYPKLPKFDRPDPRFDPRVQADPMREIKARIAASDNGSGLVMLPKSTPNANDDDYERGLGTGLFLGTLGALLACIALYFMYLTCLR
jgi:hypothetical protein